jgi:hypothetical protein
MAALPSTKVFDQEIADILAIPTLAAYSRVLCVVEDVAELALSSPDSSSADVVELVNKCRAYQHMCMKAVDRLAEQASLHEHKVYENTTSLKITNASVEPQPKRQGVIFQVDKGEHVVAALEAIGLEKFLIEQEQEQEQKDTKKVHWLGEASI